jgi:hypothetical protein
MWPPALRLYPFLGLAAGYALLMFFNPVQFALRDGLRCLGRFKRIWLVFAGLGFAYFIFQFATFTPIQSATDLSLEQITSLPEWLWPRFTEIWRDTPLPALEGVAGIFDNATTTYPVSVIAAVLLFTNWRGLHGVLFSSLRKRFGFWSYLIYLILFVSAVASLLKPIVFSWLPQSSGAKLLQGSATIDAISFIFEYLFGIYLQVYLITVCLAWVKGLSFEEGELLRFAMRRFGYVLEWAGVVVLISTLMIRLPLLLAYFMDIPDVLDFLPIQRTIMCVLIIAFCSVQISLALHNETLGAALRAHREFIRKNFGRFGWFLLICALHFFLITVVDAIVRGAIGDRLMALFLWKCMFVALRGFITGWLLASWVCLFRQSETGRVGQETWIQY